MESIRDSLRAGNSPVQWAAVQVASLQEGIATQLQPHVASIHVASVQRGRATIQVDHSALAGLLKIHQAAILEYTNAALKRRFPRQYLEITELTIRVGA